MSEAIDRIDWDLLHHQKQILVTLRSRLSRLSPECEALSGIIHLLDALQDEAEADGRWVFPDDTEGDDDDQAE